MIKKSCEKEKMKFAHFKDIQVSLFIAVSVVIVFALYITTAIKTIPCDKNLMSIFFSNFVHLEPSHLIANLFALYNLARVEKQLGPKKFGCLIVFLLIFTTVTEVCAHKLFSELKCSIGLSGILFGIMSWELTTKRGLDLMIVLSIIGVVVTPTVQNSKGSSLLGHAVGAIAGVIGGILWKMVGNKLCSD